MKLYRCATALLVSLLPVSSPSIADDRGAANATAYEATTLAPGDLAHERLLSDTRFPSAQACRVCHPDHYREWSVSQHAYAQLSPIFNAMQATIVKQTNG